jgi:thiamine biosynthesis lipoprotein
VRLSSFGAAIVVGLAMLGTGCPEPGHAEQTWPLQGDDLAARAELHTLNKNDLEIVFGEIRRSLEKAESDLLAGREDGALGELNRGAAEGYYSVQDHDLYRCVLLALDYAKASQGAFDPTVGPLLELYDAAANTGRAPDPSAIDRVLPSVGWQNVAVAEEPRAIRFRQSGMLLDLGGVAKGFVLDLAARNFARPGCLAGLLRLDGNAYAWGVPPGEAEWLVGLPDPRDGEQEWIRVGVANRGVAVSGHAEPDATATRSIWDQRILLDPVTGRPAATDLIAALAIADSAADADALATSLFIAGSMRGAEMLKKMRRVEAILVVRGDDGPPSIMASASLAGRVELSPRLAEETGGRVRYLLPPSSL